jgi:DUF177 domain-containing protein
VRINVQDIPEGGLLLQLTGEDDVLSESLARLKPQKGVTIDPKVHGTLQIVKDGSEIRLFGMVEGVVRLRCARCLSDFPLEVKVSPDLVVRHGDLTSRGRQESAEGEVEALFIEGEEIDVGDVIIQEFLLEIPMKPLCRDDCPGLCPRCGALKGSPECKCPDEEPADSRWAALARLKKRMPS